MQKYTFSGEDGIEYTKVRENLAQMFYCISLEYNVYGYIPVRDPCQPIRYTRLEYCIDTLNEYLTLQPRQWSCLSGPTSCGDKDCQGLAWYGYTPLLPPTIATTTTTTIKLPILLQPLLPQLLLRRLHSTAYHCFNYYHPKH